MEILSQMWSPLGLFTVLHNALPLQLLSLSHSLYESLQDLLSLYSYFEILEFNDYCGVDLKDLYLNAVNYSLIVACRRLTLSRLLSLNRISFTVGLNHTVHDAFRGHRILKERRNFTLRLLKHHRHVLVSPYLTYVTSCVEEFECVSRVKALHLQHPRFWLL
ncbi:hypothetical protein JHK82_018862 [Glycine max]|uniref:Uncharacterized protein n=1 Tax=Glycine max TaxID=3847 RepID=A0A0R0JD27_SOYBN|nr:hypothetical protein JHK87_018751 [Glycine soja]KAG5022963.1 hypothetical protein JHK85_019305 [Glycine max]KAG5143167.1 hypothetical protein JHK82_018862 [Glycine max]